LNVVVLAGAGVTSKINEQGIEFNERWVPEIAASIGLLPNVRVLVTGSSFEYGTSGEVDNLLDPVSSLLRPTEAYGISKKNGFIALQRRMHHGLKIGYARIFQVWGGDEHPSRLAPMLLANAENGIATTLNSGGAVRDFVHVNEVSEQIIDYFLNVDFYPSVFNICSGVPTTVKTFSRAILNSHDFNSDLLLDASDSDSHSYRRLVGLCQPLFGAGSVRVL
jgi:nucleoside-diphosphate-sugar epimerase